jgi:hypothetical protein
MPNFPGMENKTLVSTLFSNVGWASILILLITAGSSSLNISE